MDEWLLAACRDFNPLDGHSEKFCSANALGVSFVGAPHPLMRFIDDSFDVTTLDPQEKRLRNDFSAFLGRVGGG